MRGMKEMMSCHMKIEESNEICIFKDYNKIDKRNLGEWRNKEIKYYYCNMGKKTHPKRRGGVSQTPFIRPFSSLYLF